MAGQSYRVHATAGNLNNHVGLPLTLLQTPASANLLVLELGMSAPGEIQALAAICCPTVRVITEVAAAHVAGGTPPQAQAPPAAAPERMCHRAALRTLQGATAKEVVGAYE